jgi:hypothetical protein
MSHTFIPGRAFRRGLEIRKRRSWDMDSGLLASQAHPVMTIGGSINTSWALDISAGAAYAAHSGTTVPAPRAPYARRNAGHLDCVRAID